MESSPLTEGGVIHLSVGFQGPFILQVFSVRRHPVNPQQVNMCLTDGQVYIGGCYIAPKFFELENYNLVRVTGQYFDRAKPIVVKTLDIVSKDYKRLIGSSPYTLVDYFNNETNNKIQFEYDSISEPRKKIKTSSGEEFKSIKLSSNSTDGLSYGMSNSGVCKREESPLQTVIAKKQPRKSQVNSMPGNTRSNAIEVNGFSNQSQPQSNGSSYPTHEQKMKKKLRIADESGDESNETGRNTSKNSHYNGGSQSQSTFKPTFIKEDIRTTNPIDFMETAENSLISDLFERHTGWVILCRVNYRSLAKCENGLYAVNFVITDETGDEIKCVCFEASIEKAKEMLKVGKYYMFACGEIKENKRELQIIFDRNSQMVEKTNVRFQINPQKITRIDKIMEEDPEREINVIGVIRKIKNKGEMLKTKKKFSATICDPLTNYEIDFLLFLNEDEKPIEKGMVVVLHSYQVYRQGNICRLNSTYRSYYYEEKAVGKEEESQLVGKLTKSIQKEGWDSEHYKNISMFAFTQRNIFELKNIYRQTEDDRVYSSVDCWVMEISKKKSYYACKTCKKPTEKKEMGLFQCSHCKKMVDVILTYTLSVTFTDFTGSVMIDVIGEHAENLIEKKALEFYASPSDEQNAHLESLRYKNVQLRLKTERKLDGKLGHSVWGVERVTPETTLKEIKKYISQKSIRFDDTW